jgi:hypothetical protein
MYLAAVDPGLRACGLALFLDSTLITSALVDNTYHGDTKTLLWSGMVRAVLARLSHNINVVVVEKPQIYQDSPDPNTLVDLAVIAGTIAIDARHSQAVDYWPHEWKGTVKKEVMTTRIVGWLTLEERARLPKLSKNKLHNVIDAVGLGIHHLSVLGLRKKGPA